MSVCNEAFLFGVGDQVLYDAPDGRLMRAVIMRRLRDREMPDYQIRSLYAPESEGVSCLQYWLRPIPIDKAELRKYMEKHSPPGTYGDFAAGPRRL